VELFAVGLAATQISETQIEELRRLLDQARENITENDVLRRINMAFHKGVAAASGNSVLPEMLGVLGGLFSQAQRLILNIYGSNMRDHSEHLAILDALVRRDPDLARRRMEAHLNHVRDAIMQWNPEEGLPNGP
jgi:GntR family transcriptional repressor for pyruvate dehydrogenase complex